MSYQDRLAKLESEIYERPVIQWSTGALTTYKNYIPYAVILCVSFIMVYLIRPKWITIRVQRHVRRICVTRFLAVWMLVSTLLGLLYYRYGSTYFAEVMKS
jgi:hypothetical protein